MTANIYFEPEESGLKIFEMAQDSDLSYAFDMFVIWEDIKTGDLYYASDSGCSCPVPFEDESRETITKIDLNYSLGIFSEDIHSWNQKDEHEFKESPTRIQEIITKVQQHLNR